MYRKSLFIIIGLVVLLFVGCKGNDKETNFIPTLPPAYKEVEIDIPDDTVDEIDDTTDIPDDLEDEPVYTGETTTKYVKLSSYGAILNVRSSPSTEENNIVGFLVHTEPVEVISVEGEWAKIIYLDEIRYVSNNYLVDFVPPYISPPTQTSED
jgi:hypothetical protein